VPGHRKDFPGRRGEFADNRSRGRAKFVHAIRIGLRDPQTGIDPRLIVSYGRNVASQRRITRQCAEKRTYNRRENPPDFPTVSRTTTPPCLNYPNLEVSCRVEVAKYKREIRRIRYMYPDVPKGVQGFP